jgi:hypothetical protein
MSQKLAAYLVLILQFNGMQFVLKFDTLSFCELLCFPGYEFDIPPPVMNKYWGGIHILLK